jgi:hypothetical protein
MAKTLRRIDASSEQERVVRPGRASTYRNHLNSLLLAHFPPGDTRASYRACKKTVSVARKSPHLNHDS